MSITLKDAAASQKVFEFLRPSDYLRAVYLHIKKHSSRYSYRKFADELGYGPSNYMHLICTGQRKLTLKAAKDLSSTLQLRGDERRYFELLVSHECTTSPNKKEDLFSELIEIKHKTLPSVIERDMLEYLSEWYYPVVRELANYEEFRADPEWIAEKVIPPITIKQATEALELLIRIGFLVRSDSSERLTPKDIHITTGSLVRSMSVTRYHQVMIELARTALTTVKSQARDFQAITLPVSEKLMHEIKSDITVFWQAMLEKSEQCSEVDRIYQLNIQLFPVSSPLTPSSEGEK
ncbi:MAG: TIGR02147 family protein [Pseudomonadota bacterium]